MSNDFINLRIIQCVHTLYPQSGSMGTVKLEAGSMISLYLSHVPQTSAVSSSVGSEQSAIQMRRAMPSVSANKGLWVTRTVDAIPRSDRAHATVIMWKYTPLALRDCTRGTRWEITSSGVTTTTIQCISITVA